MNRLPQRRKRPKMGTREPAHVRSHGHEKWVRGFECIVASEECDGRIQACHVRSSRDGGMGLRPGDNFIVPMCMKHHRIQHNIGEPAFERRYSVDLRAIAGVLARRSPHLRKLENR